MSLAPACRQVKADASRSRMLAAGWSRPSIAFRSAWPAASSSGVHQCAPSNSSAVHGSGARVRWHGADRDQLGHVGVQVVQVGRVGGRDEPQAGRRGLRHGLIPALAVRHAPVVGGGRVQPRHLRVGEQAVDEQDGSGLVAAACPASAP